MGGLGKIESQKLDPSLLSRASTLYLKEVKLRREYGPSRAPKAMIVTVPIKMRPETPKFARWYSQLFGMKLLDSEASVTPRASIHISDDSNRIRVALTSPLAEKEVGPSYMISRIDWGQVDTTQNEKRNG